ncbi:asparaginase [Falsiroseomonas sp. CW058]|uniref:asparaginase n=1 Tax=Falsiroseomonas sp. CW058 TaxID=3388664 RepID=UPI003D312CDC
MVQSSDYVELARVWRGPVVESTHRGAVVVAGLSGGLRNAWGNHGLVTTPRSALKPFQAVALVESGAADAFGLSEEHIALACASHHAQPFQVALVTDWLGRLGLDEGALVCGPALPKGTEDMAAAFAQGGPRRVFHNCSGKHCGFLTVARHLGAGLDYADRAHPAQRLYMDILSEYTGRDAAALPAGVDNCGLPAIALPMVDMARACARLAAGAGRTEARRAAAQRVMKAMAAHPDHLAGTDEPTARIIRATGGKVVLKGGAEGFVAGFARELGFGIAVKIADGATRGKMGTLVRILCKLGALSRDEAEALMETVEPPVTDSNGNVIGGVEVPFERPVPTTPTRATPGFWFSGVPVLEDVFKP